MKKTSPLKGRPSPLRGRPSPHRGKGRRLAWLKERIGYAGDECLIWPGSRNEKGYGQIGYNGKMCKAHRVMCILAHGEPPEPGYHAAHSCHNGHLGCVHPQHLSWQTPSQNTRDAVEQNGGVIGGYRTLFIEDVGEIRASAKTHGDLAAQYGVDINTIGKICRGEIWAKPRSTMTREQLRTIREMDEAGVKIAQIARTTGINYSVIWRTIKNQAYRGLE